MRLNTARAVFVETDGSRDVVTVEVELKRGAGSVARLTPAGTEWQLRFLDLDRAGLSRAGNGSATAVVTTPGLYAAHSQHNSVKRAWTYFEVVARDGGLSIDILGTDVEGTAPATRRALDERHGIAAARVSDRERREVEESVLADELERDGRVMLAVKGLTVEITRLRAPSLRGSEKQVRWARRVRITALRGYLLPMLARLAQLIRTKPTLAAQAVENIEMLGALVQDILTRHAQADYWIDRRTTRGEETGDGTFSSPIGAPSAEKVAALALADDERPRAELDIEPAP
ncbi:hypothetical protein LXT21_43765 [Myxococcus sp. K38C18041901]|uniref:hypothetical protein n=1 Tax=Myxococcus guangdongensis TaxID=2906760 RepID=UPI0020A6E22E|nr:hypothetical protein [Myxococcus guangdongensis]MCP3065708.1 hypothetical protein [Myxococcus guangdongensis]